MSRKNLTEDIEKHDCCPKCGSMALPRYEPDSRCTAVMCQWCLWIWDRVELERVLEKIKPKGPFCVIYPVSGYYYIPEPERK